jgi:DNA polymerase III delta prime subunit
LHNTILLTGPPGTGKTAAVYACAEELGWEVFEVYPGIGRRNGANVENLVGEVGKNHLVRKKSGATRQDSIATLLSNNAGAGGESEDWAGSREASGVKQSLILLEEVDVLFKNDVNFWATVTNLIRECRRPVICTCNGKEAVPVEPNEQ